MDNSDRDAKQILRELNAALGELNAGLARASLKLDADRRCGWLEALDALWRFLDGLNHPDVRRTTVPIATLMAALRDLDLSKVDPALRPSPRKKGGQVDGYDRAVTRSIAAAWMDFLMQTGRTKADAARTVACGLEKLGVQLGNRRNSSIGATVEKWRERLDEGSDQAVARDFYKFFKAKYQYPPGTPAKVIEAEFPKLVSEALAGRVKKSDCLPFQSDQPPEY